MLVVQRDGRRLKYSVNLDAQFRHPTLKGVSLSCLLSGITSNGSLAESREPALSR
jgi:hypothetical protein